MTAAAPARPEAERTGPPPNESGLEHPRRRARDAGVSSVEVVLLMPLIVTMILIIVSLGVMVNVRSEVSGAARDAARAGSLQGTGDDAARLAKDTALADLGKRCQGSPTVDSVFVPPAAANAADGGGYYRVTVTCTVDMSGFGVFGAHKTFTKTFSAPVDPLQHFVPGKGGTTPPTPPSDTETGPSPTGTQFTAPSYIPPTPSPTPTPTPTPTGATPTTPKGTTGGPPPTDTAGH